jgi:dUTP pyrophosphatase
MSKDVIQYKLSKEAKQLGLYPNGPTASTKRSAGIDLYCANLGDVVIKPGASLLIPTGLHLWIGSLDDNIGDMVALTGLLVPRSSSNFTLANTVGIIDCDYQGELLIKVHNPHANSLILTPSQKLAQLVLMLTFVPGCMEFKQVDYFTASTERGEGGFGSTGG